MPTGENGLKACCWQVAFGCGAMDKRLGVELCVVAIDIRGRLLASDAEPLHQLSGDQASLPEGDQLDGAQAQKDFMFERWHVQNPEFDTAHSAGRIRASKLLYGKVNGAVLLH